MKSAINDIKGETAGDTITLTFNLQLDGTFFPADSTWSFSAAYDKTTIVQSGSAVNSADDTAVTVIIPQTKTTRVGVYNYALIETTSGGATRTAVRGKFELEKRI